jgi:hypothetical protein
MLTIRETWQCRAVDVLTTIPALYAAHPDYPTAFLQGPVEMEIVSDIATYQLIYKGFDAESGGGGTDPDDSPPRYFFNGVDRTIPITLLDRLIGACRST